MGLEPPAINHHSLFTTTLYPLHPLPQMDQRDTYGFSSESIYAGVFYLDKYLISTTVLTTTLSERRLLKMVIWTVLDLFGLISDRNGGPGLTPLLCVQN